MNKKNIIYKCEVCEETRKGRYGTGVTCRYCNKFMLFKCGCYGTLSIPRKCCDGERNET